MIGKSNYFENENVNFAERESEMISNVRTAQKVQNPLEKHVDFVMTTEYPSPKASAFVKKLHKSVLRMTPKQNRVTYI